ncbi:hypothetical protein K456DRAFT_1334957 [Colletotrichum gloeosporioides 23]|nr:hypothetical protein K456DRAFT_1334957 [Colletotrichum gloeosporioides 23]
MTSAYSPDQVSLYLECIGVPERCRHEPPTLEFLTMLHIHTISTLPYENLSLHYNPSHNISLDPQYLFRKMVTDKRGRGGFCMEIAILYNHILRALGFDAYTAGVRTRPRIEGVPKGDFPRLVRHLTPHSSYPVHIRYQFYLPLTPRLLRGHIVNIVTFADGSKYHSDVAFGGDGATKPMPLIEVRSLGSMAP